MTECILCGHDAIDPEYGPVDGEAYCQICLDSAVPGELPAVTVSEMTDEVDR